MFDLLAVFLFCLTLIVLKCLYNYFSYYFVDFLVCDVEIDELVQTNLV